jgi:hypothetical protein
MRRISMFAVLCVALPLQAAICQDAISLTNITVKIVKHGGKRGFSLDATLTNPNDFAVSEARVSCDIKDGRGRQLASYVSTIVDSIQSKEVKTIRRLDIGAWPDRGSIALCQSLSAKRLSQ